MTESLTIIDSSLGGALLVNSLRSLGYKGALWLILDTQNFPLDTKSPQICFRSLHSCLQFSRKINAFKTVVACPSMASVMQKTHMIDGDLISSLELLKDHFLKSNFIEKTGLVSTESLEKMIPHPFECKQLSQIKTPLIAQLAHEGWYEDPLANLILYRHLSALLQKHISALVLAPTYWGFFKENAAKILGSNVQILDTISTLSAYFCGELQRENPTKSEIPTPKETETYIISSDTSESFIQSLKRVLIQGFNYKIEPLIDQAIP